MNELECQKLVIDAALMGGGQGLKLNNRFLVGIVDLLIKIPGREPMWLEAKLEKLAARTVNNGHVWKLDVTKRQKDFLRDWNQAGMCTGVVSFAQEQGSNVNSLRMALYDYTTMVRYDWHANTVDHTPLGKSTERMGNIMRALRDFTPHEVR